MPLALGLLWAADQVYKAHERKCAQIHSSAEQAVREAVRKTRAEFACSGARHLPSAPRAQGNSDFWREQIASTLVEFAWEKLAASIVQQVCVRMKWHAWKGRSMERLADAAHAGMCNSAALSKRADRVHAHPHTLPVSGHRQHYSKPILLPL